MIQNVPSIYNAQSIYNGGGGGGGGGGSYLTKIGARIWLSSGYINAVFTDSKIEAQPDPGVAIDYQHRMGVCPLLDKVTFGDLAESFEIQIVCHIPSSGYAGTLIIKNDDYNNPNYQMLYNVGVDLYNARLESYFKGTRMIRITGYSVPDEIIANIKFYKSGDIWKMKFTLNGSVKFDSNIDISGLTNEGICPTFGYSKTATSNGFPQTSYISYGSYVKKDGVLIWGNDVAP